MRHICTEDNKLTDNLPEASPSWGPQTKRTVAVIGLVALALLLVAVNDILPVIIISGLLAFLLTPATNFFQRRIMGAVPVLSPDAKRGWAVLMTFALVVFLIVVAVLVIVPAIVIQLEEFAQGLPERLADVENQLELILSEPIMFRGAPVLLDGQPIIPLERIAGVTGTTDLTSIITLSELDLQTTAQTFLSSARSLTGPAFSFVGGAFNTIISLTFLIMMTFYLLKDGRRFVQVVVDLAPEEYQGDAGRIVGELGNVWNAYIRGQFILCMTIGIAVYILATLLGVPNAPILGLLAGILEFIPNLGPLLALIPAALIALVSQSMTIPFLSGVPFMIVVIVVWTGLQNVEALFIVPRVLGSSLDLHPLVVIIAVLSGAALAGPLGVILAAPTVASLRVFARYIYGKLTNRPPFPEPAPPEPVQPNWLERLIQNAIEKMKSRLSPRVPDDAHEGA
jgi:predicted PurR-regulated permease PerM